MLHNVAARMHTGVGSALRTCIPRFELEVCAPLSTTTRVTVGGQPAAERASPRGCSAVQLPWRSSAREPRRLPSNPHWVSRQKHTGGGRKHHLYPLSRARAVHGQGHQHHPEKRGHSFQDFPSCFFFPHKQENAISLSRRGFNAQCFTLAQPRAYNISCRTQTVCRCAYNRHTRPVHTRSVHCCSPPLLSARNTPLSRALCPDGTHTVRSELPATKYCGAFSSVVDGRRVLVLLLGSLNVLYRSLHSQNITGSTLGSTNTKENSEVLESDTFASAWLSVSVLDNNVTALYIDSAAGSAAVGFFHLLWA
jgi:hypothetical protein